MKPIFTAGARSLVFGFAIFVFLTLNQGVAQADTVTIHPLSIGSFNGSIFFNANVSLHGLTFQGTTFPNPVASVDRSVPSFSLSPASTFNLGTFTLTGDPATYTGNTFAIHMTFSFSNALDLDIEGSFPQFPTFPATLIGSVQGSSQGSLTIDFNNSPVVFSVSLNGNVFHVFSITLQDIVIQPGQTVSIIGAVNHISPVPEPATLLMLTSGLAALGTAVRKRRKTSL